MIARAMISAFFPFWASFLSYQEVFPALYIHLSQILNESNLVKTDHKFCYLTNDQTVCKY
jgi:hypothetical protein